MKTLVLYYSYSGTTAKIARAIADELGADSEQLCVAHEKKREGFGKYFFGGMQAVMKQKPDLIPLTVDPAAYELIIIGTPVWAGTCAPAIRTLLEFYPLAGKKTAFFYTHQGGPGHTESELASALHASHIAGTLNLCNAIRDTAAAEQKARAWCRGLSGKAAQHVQ